MVHDSVPDAWWNFVTECYFLMDGSIDEKSDDKTPYQRCDYAFLDTESSRSKYQWFRSQVTRKMCRATICRKGILWMAFLWQRTASGRTWSDDVMIRDFEEFDEVAASQIYLKRITKKLLSIVLVASCMQRRNSTFTIILQLEDLHRRNRHKVSNDMLRINSQD